MSFNVSALTLLYMMLVLYYIVRISAITVTSVRYSLGLLIHYCHLCSTLDI